MRTVSLWKRIVERQQQLIDIQQTNNDLQQSTIEAYKRILAGGVSIVTEQQKN